MPSVDVYVSCSRVDTPAVPAVWRWSVSLFLVGSGQSWAHLGPYWGHRGATLELSWATLGLAWGILGPSSTIVGCWKPKIAMTCKNQVFLHVFVHPGTPPTAKYQQSWGHLGPILGPIGATAGPLWSYLGPPWGYLGASWGHLGPSWAFGGPR